MKRDFRYTLTKENEWFVAQCLDVDVASQGRTIEEAVHSLREALELHFEAPVATILPEIETMELDIHV